MLSFEINDSTDPLLCDENQGEYCLKLRLIKLTLFSMHHASAFA